MKQIGIKNGSYKHGMYGTRIYHSWSAMKMRCLNPNYKEYNHYGERGITICPRWMKFENFYKDMGDVPVGKSIDRINNNLGYYKENCKWSTPKEQANNRRSNRLITFNNKTLNIKQWSEELKTTRKTIYGRLDRGWSIEKALTFNL